MKKHFEDDLQMQCVQWFLYQYPKISPYLVHCPNGGKRNIKEASRFKKLGVKAGFPDLVLYIKNDLYNGLALEMKFGNNKPTKHQLSWLKHLDSQGYATAIIYTFEQFTEVIQYYLRNYHGN